MSVKNISRNTWNLVPLDNHQLSSGKDKSSCGSRSYSNRVIKNQKNILGALSQDEEKYNANSRSSEQIIDRRPQQLNMNPQHPAIIEQDEDNVSSHLSLKKFNFSNPYNQQEDNVSNVSGLLSKLLEESNISEYERVISKIDLNNIS